jgi:hypothetical protein
LCEGLWVVGYGLWGLWVLLYGETKVDQLYGMIKEGSAFFVLP